MSVCDSDFSFDIFSNFGTEQLVLVQLAVSSIQQILSLSLEEKKPVGKNVD
jgi:hypothetical protein